MAKKFDLSVDLDAHFQALSQLFDAGNTSGLLMSNIDISDRLDLVLESEKFKEGRMNIEPAMTLFDLPTPTFKDLTLKNVNETIQEFCGMHIIDPKQALNTYIDFNAL